MVVRVYQWLVAWLTLSTLLWVQEVKADEVSVVTGDLPPYSYEENGRVVGVATDIVRELMRRTGQTGEIQIRPYIRAVSESYGNSFIYPMTRTEGQEGLYQWIGPLLNDRLVFALQTADPRPVKSFTDLRRMTIGVNRGAPPHLILLKRGHPYIDTTTTEQQNLKKLLAGRIDAWFSAEVIIYAELKRLHLKPDIIRIPLVDQDVGMFIAVDRHIDEAMVKRWQEELDAMKCDGSYRAIMERYGMEAWQYSPPSS